MAGPSRDGLAEKVRAAAEESARVGEQLAGASDSSEFILAGEALGVKLKEASVVVADVAKWTMLCDQLDDMLAACQVYCAGCAVGQAITTFYFISMFIVWHAFTQ